MTNWVRLWREAKQQAAEDAITDGYEALRPGHFLVQIGRGPRVPLLIEAVGEAHRAVLAGREVEVNRILLAKGEPIGRERYRFLVADIDWARSNNPSDPRLRPFEPVSLSGLPPMEP